MIVIGSLARGGSERQIVEFVSAAHPQEAECSVVCLGEEGDLAPAVRAAGAPVVALRAARSYSPRALWRFARLLRAERPDVVYAFLFWGYVIALPLAALVHPSACRIQARRSLPDHDVSRRRQLTGLRRLSDRCAHGAIANSMATGRAVAEHEPALRGRLWVVPNGVREAAASPDGRDEHLRILCVANLIAYKGHRTLLGALAALQDTEWTAAIAGEGPERPGLEELIDTLELNDRVMLIGRRDDVGALLSSADVLVHPSYTESMPNAVLEAMANGVPVIGTTVGAIPALLASGAGLLVAPRDEQALARALSGLLSDAELRASMGRRGREVIEERFSVTGMKQGTLRAIEQIRQMRGA